MLQKSKPEVVYCTTSAMVFCLPLAKLAGAKRTILHLQEIWSPREAWFLGLAARYADHIFCISTAARNCLPKSLLKRSHLLVNAHRDSEMPVVPHESLKGPLKFLVASRWNTWKGHTSLLKAWDGELSPGELTILGGPPAMGVGVDVRAMVKELRHSSSIDVVGEVENIADYIDAADYLVLPSESPEPFGLVLLEAFARGRPVIASRAGGVMDVVVDGGNGILFEMGNTDQLQTVLTTARREDAIMLGREARRHFEQHFSIESYGSRLRALWKGVVKDA
ncbi:glycosyltransferase family 4 protein [Paenarthrobacter nitroguajacolicus]